jgi:hypothetical protein
MARKQKGNVADHNPLPSTAQEGIVTQMITYGIFFKVATIVVPKDWHV